MKNWADRCKRHLGGHTSDRIRKVIAICITVQLLVVSNTYKHTYALYCPKFPVDTVECEVLDVAETTTETTTTSTTISSSNTTTTSITITTTVVDITLAKEQTTEIVTTESVITETTTFVVEPIVENKSIAINETVDSWSDYELLAHIINAEAGGCTLEEMLWTGQVVLNRVASPYFPNTIREVIFAPNQYSPTWNGALYKSPSQGAYEAARLLMDGNRYIPTNVLFQAGPGMRYKLYAVTAHNMYFYTYGE